MATPKEFGAGSVNSHRRAKRIAQGMPAGRGGVSPVRRSRSVVDQPDAAPSSSLAVPDSWVAFRQLSQSFSGSSSVVDTPSLLDFRGDYSWLQDDRPGFTTWTFLASGLYVIHVECSATTTRAAGNCVRISPTAGSDYPEGPWLSLPFLAASTLATTSLITAAGCVTKAISQDEIDTGPVTITVDYIGGSGTLSTTLTFEKVL